MEEKLSADLKKKLNEAVSYFSQEDRFATLFHAIRKKYESLGKFAGTIDIQLFSTEELDAIALLVGKSPEQLREQKKISIKQVEHSLQRTRFAGITLLLLLEAYYEESLQTNKEKQEEWLTAQLVQCDSYLQLYPQLSNWFNYIKQRTSDTYWIWRLMMEPSFADQLAIVATAYDALPDAEADVDVDADQTMERYALFSQRAIGDPHALDLTTVQGKLWIHLLHIMAGGSGAAPNQTEHINELLLQYRLLRDDIMNFVTVANLLAFKEGRVHSVWQAALDELSVLNIPLRELLQIDRVITTRESKKVYVVENAGVFSALLDEVPHATLVCTQGQFKLAGLILLDLLYASGHTIYYSGDFDPEGLAMALRLKERYGEQVQLWRMTVADYEASSPIVELGERVTKLSNLSGSELNGLVTHMKKLGKIGYQEGIMSLLISDLLSANNDK